MVKIANSGEWAVEEPEELPYDRPSVIVNGDFVHFRASGYGGCPVGLNLISEGHEEPDKPYMQPYFDAGHVLEAWIKQNLHLVEEALGYTPEFDAKLKLEDDSTLMKMEVISPNNLLTYYLTGHTDGIVSVQVILERVLEVKTTGTANFDKWLENGIDNFVNYPEYLWQLLAYLVNEYDRTGGEAIYVIMERGKPKLDEMKRLHAFEVTLNDLLALLGYEDPKDPFGLAYGLMGERLDLIMAPQGCEPSAFCDMDDIRVELESLEEDWLMDQMKRRIKLSLKAAKLKVELDKLNADIRKHFVDNGLEAQPVAGTTKELYLQTKYVLAMREVKA